MTHSTMETKETALFLACCCVRSDAESAEQLRELIRGGVDWAELIRLAIPHGLLPLVARNLSAQASDIVPSRTLYQLEMHRKRTEERNRAQLNELLRILELFSKRGIRALPFKGPLLAVAAYGDLSLRESHDLDIWLHPDQLATAGELLREENYRGAGHTRGTVHLLKRDGGSKQGEFLNTDSGVLIELHDELQSPQFSFSPDFDQVWSRREETKIEGRSIAAMSTADLLITLAVHGSKHTWRRLSWVVDITGLIERSGMLNWDEMLLRATDWHARRRLLFACALAEEMLKTPFPEEYRQEFTRNSYTRSSVRRVRTHIIDGFGTRDLSNYISELRSHVENADTVPDRLRIISSYARKIMQVDETRMLRPMDQETQTMYRLSRGIRLFLGRLVS